MEQKRRRGRPSKSANQQPINQEVMADNIPSIESQIEDSQFEFFKPSDQAQETSFFNPLQESVEQRDYATPQIAQGNIPDLEEPQFMRKGFDQMKAEQSNGAGPSSSPSNSNSSSNSGGSAPQMSSDPMNNPNPAYNEMEDKEKKKASEQMVDAVLDTYDTLKTLSAKLGQMDEKKVRKMIEEGKIDKNRRITIDEYGNTVGIMEFITNYNAQVVQAVEPDPSFRKSVRPAMTRVFMKKGWGMTDEQYLLFAFGKDLTISAVTLIGMKKGVKDILNNLQEEQLAKGNPIAPQRPTPPPPSSSGGYDNPPAPPNYPPSNPPTNSPSSTPNDEFVEYPQEDLTDEELDYLERIESAQAELTRNNIKEEAYAEADQVVEKMNIEFESPLRQEQTRSYQVPNVEETFTKGAEIKDDLSMNP
jgi:hypothetical protein